MTRRSRLVRALAVPLLVGVLAGCNPSLTPPTYRPPDSSLVTQAALDPCPTSGKAVSGGLPKITLHCLGDGPSVDLAGLKGPAIVNLWYASCSGCISEAPVLRAFAQAAKGKVLLLGVDSEAYPDPALSFAADHGLHYPSVVDQHSDLSGKLAITEFPSTYFVDAAGHLVGKPFQAYWATLAQLTAEVKARLGVTVS